MLTPPFTSRLTCRIGRAAGRFALVAVAAACGTSAMAAGVTVRIADQSTKALPDAVVYVVPMSGKLPPRVPQGAIIDQIDKEFAPFVSVIQTGTSVTMPNKDNFRHHVYSFSPPKIFELKLYSGVPAKPVVFDKPGLVVLGCNIHDNMLAYVLVVDTPWFAKAGADGVARIDNLPPGAYEVHVWHYREKADFVRRDVKVEGETTVAAGVELNN